MESELKFRTVDEFVARKPQAFRGLGQHLIVDFHDCKLIPQRAGELEQMMLETARIIDATVVTSSFHAFSPIGLSGVVVIAESHLAAHTWPEHGVVCIDLFTCSGEMKSNDGVAFLFESLQAASMSVRAVARGGKPDGESKCE